MSAPLILLEGGYEKWRILEPNYSYGTLLDGTEDRRYGEICVIHGDLAEATRVLHQLERGR